jgi:hypothetical protein
VCIEGGGEKLVCWLMWGLCGAHVLAVVWLGGGTYLTEGGGGGGGRQEAQALSHLVKKYRQCYS